MKGKVEDQERDSMDEDEVEIGLCGEENKKSKGEERRKKGSVAR